MVIGQKQREERERALGRGFPHEPIRRRTGKKIASPTFYDSISFFLIIFFFFFFFLFFFLLNYRNFFGFFSFFLLLSLSPPGRQSLLFPRLFKHSVAFKQTASLLTGEDVACHIYSVAFLPTCFSSGVHITSCAYTSMRRSSTPSSLLAIVAVLAVASSLATASAHGDDGMDMSAGHMASSDDTTTATTTTTTTTTHTVAFDSPEAGVEDWPMSYFSYGQHSGTIVAHIALMIIAWFFVLPPGMYTPYRKRERGKEKGEKLICINSRHVECRAIKICSPIAISISGRQHAWNALWNHLQ